MSALTRITEIGAEMAQLARATRKARNQQFTKAQRITGSESDVGETVLSQVKQVAAAAAPTPQPRSTPRSRGSHASRQTHFETGHESPQYQPQMYLASHNQFPSTSTAQFQEYSTGNANQTQIVHQQEQVCGRQQNQQRTYRAQTATTTVYHPPPQLPPGTVYVQNVPQAAQAQFTSSQPTVGSGSATASEAFVRDSAIIAALRDTDYESAEKPKLANPPSKPSSSKSIMQQYEYHTFDEIPRVVSPYKSPSPFKSPASSIRSEKSEARSTPLPPPLSSVVTRRSTPL
ncbi:hypothetical protein OSTOST_21701, partial [Ostertagia ostertagi]